MKTPDLQPIGNALAAQHNAFIRTPLRMGVIESRIFIQALSDINHETTEFPTTIIPMSSFMRSKRDGEAYEDVRKAVDALVGRTINLLRGAENKERVHKIPLMAEVEIVHGQSAVRVSFNAKAKPYLLQLKDGGNFTQADIVTLLTFKNPNSTRLYWILKSYANLGQGSLVTQAVQLEDLKLWLLEDASLYPVYADFIKRVVEPVFKEFAAVGYSAAWKAVRTGKKTTALQFTIPRNQPALPAATSTKGTSVADTFAAWLTSQSQQLQSAYHGLISKDGNQLNPVAARRIIHHVAGNSELETVLYQTRYQLQPTPTPNGTTRAAYSMAQIKAALGLK